MKGIAKLTNKLERVQSKIDRRQDEYIEERIHEWAQEGLFRKLEAFKRYIEGELTLAQYHQATEAITHDIESRKTETEKQAEQRYRLNSLSTGAAAALLHSLQRGEHEKLNTLSIPS